MSTRYPGGLITKTPVVPTINSAPGVWTLEQALVYIKAGTWPGGVTIDPYFNQTTLLLHGDGTNGAQNNTFLDSSTNNFTITRNGNTTQGTFSPFSLAAGQWSNYFSGNGNYISANPSTAVNFGSGSFTLEAWVYLTSMSTSATIIGTRTGDTSSTIRWVLYVISGTNTLEIDIWNTANARIAYFSHQTALSLNTWYHVAFVRNGTGFRLYLNGVQSTSSATSSDAVANSNTVVTIGQSNGGFSGTNAPLVGYISNARIVKGTALYTSSFTPPTTPLTNIANTSLLTCQSNRFVDNGTANSGSGFPISIVGSPRVTPFSPFAPTAAYSAGTNGGSGYFDGNSDYLTAASNAAFAFGTGDFTIEAWINPASLATDTLICGVDVTNGAILGYSTSTVWLGSRATAYDLTATYTLPLNSWTHIAVSRQGTTARLFANGVQIASGTVTKNYPQGVFTVGNYTAVNIGVNGYLFNVRAVKGTAVYTGAFTPPTLPLSTSGAASASAYPSTTNINTTFASSETSLLLNFTNAGIFDNTGKNNLETVGNAQIDTAVKKYGTGSLEFDGSGDWLLGRREWSIAASENFTIEGWLYLTAAQNTLRMIVSELAATANNSKYLSINSTGVEIQMGTTAGTVASCTFSFSQNTWYHLAVVRSSNTIAIYVDGVSQSVSQSSQSGAFLDQGSVLYVGRWGGSTAYEWFGFIDDLRITKGIARYTANFVPPVARFPNQ